MLCRDCGGTGGEDVGKSSLVRQLQVLGSSAPSLSAVEMHENTGGVSPLDFAFIGVRKLLDEEDVKTADVETTSQVWILQRPQDWSGGGGHRPRAFPPSLIYF